jgi:pimeloyl-ACP methyl ester carboxylesterase
MLVGHSFGGYLATLLAHRFPERIDRLVLMNTTGNIRHLGVLPRTAANLPALILQMVHRAIPVLLSMPPHVARRFVDQALHEWECWHLYPDLRCPTLVISGAFDHIAPPAHVERIVRAIPNARGHVLPFSRHMTMLERSGQVAELLERFLVPSGSDRVLMNVAASDF